MKKNLILVIFSFLFSIVIIEVILRLTGLHFKSNPTNAIHEKGLVQFDSTLGYVLTPGFKGKQFVEGYNYDVWVNSIGFYDKEFLDDGKNIFLLGDSFTWGYAPFEDKWGTILEKRLGIRVVKAGILGYGTYQEYLLLKRYLPIIKPKMVILGYCLNDILDDYLFPSLIAVDGFIIKTRGIGNIETGDIKEFYTSKDEILKKINEQLRKKQITYIDIKNWLRNHLASYSFFADKSKLFFNNMLLKLGFSDSKYSNIENPLEVLLYVKNPPSWVEKAWEKHLLNLLKIKEVTDSFKNQLLIEIIPDVSQVYEGKWLLSHEYIKSNYIFEKNLPNVRLHRFFDDNGINYLDLLDGFKENADTGKYFLGKYDLYYNIDGHWNIEGNRLAVKLVSEYIKDNYSKILY